MSSAWTHHIPENIVLEQCERQNVDCLSSKPPICIVLDLSKVDEATVDTVTIKLSDGTKHTSQKFVGDTNEEAIHFI